MSNALDNMKHAYWQTDGTYKFPNSWDGDILKQAKAEIEELKAQVEELKKDYIEESELHRKSISRRVELQAQLTTEQQSCERWKKWSVESQEKVQELESQLAAVKKIELKNRLADKDNYYSGIRHEFAADLREAMNREKSA